jgi:integrase
MSDTYRLQCRNGTWYYHRRVPDHLVGEFGRNVVKVSLGTKSKAEAKKLRTIQDLKWDAQFASFEQQGASPSVPSSKVTVPLADIVRDYVKRMDRKSELAITENGPVNRDELASLVENAEIELGILQNPDDPRQEEWISRAWDRVLQSTNVSFEPIGSAREQFYALVRRALLELTRRRLARATDDFGRAHFDEIFNPSRGPDITFGALVEEYLAWKKEVGRVNKRDAKTTDKIIANVALVREIIGEDTPVSRIDHDACERFLRLLAATPTNRTKLYPGIPLEQAAERATLQNKPLLSHKTQLQYLGTLRDILQRALRKQVLTYNPAAGLQPLTERTEANHEKRDPFTIPQLNTFFRNAFYKECAKDRSSIYAASRNVWRFWLPLICLFTGMRPREAAQIEISDIQKSPAGTWFISIAPSEEQSGADAPDGGYKTRKSIKTATSRRRIPIHPELEKLGFWELLNWRRKQNFPSTFLFSEMPVNKYGDRVAYALRRFNEDFLPKAMEMGERQSFYSFRHSFRDALRRCKAPSDTLQALGGWSQANSASDDYGDKTDPDLQVEWIRKVHYPILDLTELYIETGLQN